MRHIILAASLTFISATHADAQTPMNAYSTTVTVGAYNIPLMMTQPASAAPSGMYSGRTPSAALSGSTPLCISAANLQQLNPSTVRMSISVGGPRLGGGAYTASYEATGTLGGDITLGFVNGLSPLAWPSSIALTKTTSATVID